MSDQTTCIHGGGVPDPVHGALLPPIHQSTTFRQAVLGGAPTHTYSRSSNPTVSLLEERLGALEGAPPAVCFATGMAATTTLCLTVLGAGDHVVCSDVVYGGTWRLLREVLAGFGVAATFVDSSDPAAVRAALRPTTRLAVFESPANPTLKLTDLAACCAAVRERGVLAVVDNTFLTPVLQRPLDLGADATLCSTTKYVDGHNATVGGALVSRDETLLEALRLRRTALGTIQSPQNAWLTLQGLKTLPLRLAAHCRHAFLVASALRDDDRVRDVRHPSLADFPQRALALRQQADGGGLVTFEVVGGLPAAAAFLARLEVCTPAENLGAVETLATHPASMTHHAVPAAERAARGIGDGLVRLSVGLEDPVEIIADLQQALRAVEEVGHA